MPQHVAFVQWWLRDVRDVDVEPAIVVVVAEVRVHPFLRVPTDRSSGHVDEPAVAVVSQEPVGPEVVRDVHVLPAVPIVVAVPDVERPSGVDDAGQRGGVRERTVAVVPVQNLGTAVLGVVQRIEQEPGGVDLE